MFSPAIVSDNLVILYTIPEFIPDGRKGRQRGPQRWMRAGRGPEDHSLIAVSTLPLSWPARGLEFLMILGTESYTNFTMVPKGMFYNPYNNLLFIWGNFLLQRYGAGPMLPLLGPSGWGPFLK